MDFPPTFGRPDYLRYTMVMRTLLFTFLLMPGLLWAQPAADAVTGVWLTGDARDDQGYIQIYREGDTFFGRIVGAPPSSARRDSEQDQELLGTRILEGFVYDDEGTWEDGTVYDPDNDKTYSAKLWLEDADTLNLRGFIGFSLLGRTDTWTRAGRDADGVVDDALK